MLCFCNEHEYELHAFPSLDKGRDRRFGVPPLGGCVDELSRAGAEPAEAGTPNSLHLCTKNHAKVFDIST